MTIKKFSNNQKLLQRKQIRLKGYDYSDSGYYFITICTKDRECLFGNVANGEMKTNTLGKLVESTCESLPDRFSVIIDTYQIMPNHFHGIIVINREIVGAGLVPARGGNGHPQGVPLQIKQPTLGDIIGAFKSLSTNAWSHGKFWQRNYYEHIIRNESELNEIREYIKTNPEMWDRDRNNPELKFSTVDLCKFI